MCSLIISTVNDIEAAPILVCVFVCVLMGAGGVYYTDPMQTHSAEAD